MRVLFVQGAGTRGGAERVLLALARHLPVAGVDPVIAAVADGPFLSECEREGIEVLRLPPAPRARDVRGRRRVTAAVAEAIVATGADVVHSNGESMALLGGPAARRTGRPSVVWLHDAPARSLAATAVQVGLLTGRHDALVAPSKAMARAFRRRLRVRATTIPHGLDLDVLPSRPADVRAEASWPPDAVVVGHFARLQNWKGGDIFLEAAVVVAERHPAARFLVVGGALYGWEEDYAASLPRRAEELGLGNRVRFLGHREDALDLMAGCDVIVHASRRPEPFGLVVLEALALGRAVVATRTGGPEEVIDEGFTGSLTDPGDAAGLAAEITRLVGDPALRELLGRAGAEAVRARWSASTMAARFADLYASVARPRATARGDLR